MIKAVFFDLDLTLIDAEQAHKTATEKAFAHFGYDYAKVKTYSPNHISLGKRVEDNLRVRYNAAQITEEQLPFEQLLEMRQTYFLAAVMQGAVLMRGAEYALEETKKRGCISAIVSSGSKKYLDIVIHKFNFKRWLDFVVTGDDVQSGKPNPECYIQALKCAHKQRPDLGPHECLVIEDTEAGITAGKDAHMKVVFVPTPAAIFPTDPLPDFTLSSLNDLSDTQFT